MTLHKLDKIFFVNSALRYEIFFYLYQKALCDQSEFPTILISIKDEIMKKGKRAVDFNAVSHKFDCSAFSSQRRLDSARVN